MVRVAFYFFFFSSRRRHTRCLSDWSSDVCSSDLALDRALSFKELLAHPILADQAALLEGRGVDPGLVSVPAGPCATTGVTRSEERRVGKECRSRWWTED